MEIWCSHTAWKINTCWIYSLINQQTATNFIFLFCDLFYILNRSLARSSHQISAPRWRSSSEQVSTDLWSWPEGTRAKRFLYRGVWSMSGGGSPYGEIRRISGRGGSRIPRRRGRQPSMRRYQNTHFPKNCMKLRKFWSVGWGARTGGAPWIRYGWVMVTWNFPILAPSWTEWLTDRQTRLKTLLFLNFVRWS